MQELCIENGLVITMDEKSRIIEDGAVRISGPHITYCGPREQEPARPDGIRLLDAGGGLILPGLINGHSHAPMVLMRGMGDDLPLETWLTEHVFPTEQKWTPKAIYQGAMLACLEMIKNGVTSFSDMYLFAPQVAKAVDDSGLRAVVGEVIYDFPSPSYGELENGYAVTRELIEHYRDHPRITGAVMPHSTYTCSPDLLTKAGELAGELDVDFVTHLSETKVENAQVVERYGKKPLAHLDSLGLVTERLWIDHGVHLDEAEIDLLAKTGARVTHCPESNMKLASGAAPLDRMVAAGVAVGLGTDGCASNNDLDMLGEMDTCAKLHKVTHLDPTRAPAAMVLSLATSLGAKAMRETGLGVLREGALADIIVIDTNKPHLTPMYNPYSHLVYAARGSDVMHTVCHGRVLMENRKVLSLDESEVLAKAAEGARTLGLEMI